MPKLMVPIPCYQHTATSEALIALLAEAETLPAWKQPNKPSQTDAKIPARTRIMNLINVYVFLRGRGGNVRARIALHLPLAETLTSTALFVLKYRSLINKSLARIHSIQDSSSLVPINPNNTMRRLRSALRVRASLYSSSACESMCVNDSELMRVKEAVFRLVFTPRARVEWLIQTPNDWNRW